MCCIETTVFCIFFPSGCFLKWWYPTSMGFPTKNHHFGVFWGYHHLRKHPSVGISAFVGSQFHWRIPFLFEHRNRVHPGRLTAGSPTHHPWKERKMIWTFHLHEDYVPAVNLQGVYLEPEHLFINGGFNWMTPNRYLENGCFTKHPLKDGCLGVVVNSSLAPKNVFSSLVEALHWNGSARTVNLCVRGWFFGALWGGSPTNPLHPVEVL